MVIMVRIFTDNICCGNRLKLILSIQKLRWEYYTGNNCCGNRLKSNVKQLMFVNKHDTTRRRNNNVSGGPLVICSRNRRFVSLSTCKNLSSMFMLVAGRFEWIRYDWIIGVVIPAKSWVIRSILLLIGSKSALSWRDVHPDRDVLRIEFLITSSMNGEWGDEHVSIMCSRENLVIDQPGTSFSKWRMRVYFRVQFTILQCLCTFFNSFSAHVSVTLRRLFRWKFNRQSSDGLLDHGRRYSLFQTHWIAFLRQFFWVFTDWWCRWGFTRQKCTDENNSQSSWLVRSVTISRRYFRMFWSDRDLQPLRNTITGPSIQGIVPEGTFILALECLTVPKTVSEVLQISNTNSCDKIHDDSFQRFRDHVYCCVAGL